MRVHSARRLAGGLATAATAVGVIALLSGEGGCELAVSESVPPFTCLPDAADVCAPGDVCVPATHQCVARSGTCTPGAANACAAGMRCDPQTLRCLKAPGLDASGNVDATPAAQADSMPDSSDVAVGDGPERDGAVEDVTEANLSDVPSDVGMCAGDIGCGCKGASDCTTGICAQELTLTTDLYAVLGMAVCTKPCCTSGDCPNGTVCFGTGGGGNYCVLPKWIGRNSGLGGGQGGASCSAPADCRSGVCSMSKCADTCCSSASAPQAAECASGTVCRFAQFPGNGFDTHETAWCGPAIGTTAGGMTCVVDNTCQSGKCNVGRCEAVCRNSTDCGTGLACSYGLAPTTLPTNKDIILGCMQAGPTPNGSNCTSNSDCQSAFCEITSTSSANGTCADACATDADCKTGMRCQPVQVLVQGSYSVLACQ